MRREADEDALLSLIAAFLTNPLSPPRFPSSPRTFVLARRF